MPPHRWGVDSIAKYVCETPTSRRAARVATAQTAELAAAAAQRAARLAAKELASAGEAGGGSGASSSTMRAAGNGSLEQRWHEMLRQRHILEYCNVGLGGRVPQLRCKPPVTTYARKKASGSSVVWLGFFWQPTDSKSSQDAEREVAWREAEAAPGNEAQGQL